MDPIQAQYIPTHERGPWADYGEAPFLDPTSPTPLSFARVLEEPRIYPPVRLTVPDSQFVDLLKEDIGWHEAPDPIRQSDFWAHGDKIKPDARQWITSHLAIPYHETISEQSATVGKLLGYLKVPMHAGAQYPSVLRANIHEAVPTTYGSLYEVSPMVTPGPPYLSTGFDLTGSDGYPY